MPSRASSRPAPVIASPSTKGRRGGHAGGVAAEAAQLVAVGGERGEQRGADGAAGAGEQDPHEGSIVAYRAAGSNERVGQASSAGVVGDERCERERRRGGGRGGVADVDGVGRGGEQEVVDEAAVAGDGLGADAGEGGDEVVGRDARDVAGGLGGEGAAAGGEAQLAGGGAPVAAQHAPGARPGEAVARRDEQGGRAEQDVAGDRRREVDAEEREARVGDGIDEAADEVAALGVRRR